MRQAWSHDPGAFLYTADYLNSMVYSPGAGPDFAPTLYEDGRPVGFASCFPRAVVVDGRELSVVVSAHLSISPKYQKLGLGGVLLGEVVKRAKASGYDGMVQYCIVDGPMNSIVLGVGRVLGIPVQHVYSIGYRSRILFPAARLEVEPVEPEADQRQAPSMLVALASEIAPSKGLIRKWSAGQAEWQCNRAGAVAEVLVSGSRRGMLTGYVIQLAADGNPGCLVIDDVLWGTLESAERSVLLKRFLQRASAAGARLAIVPSLGYADLTPFEAGNFRPSTRVLNAYLSIWSGGEPSGLLPAFYLDVF
ncbi:MAG: GNAT family N-acetyltransferase [Caulobacteraceae bacterium]